MQLFYHSSISIDISEFTFDKQESRHIVKVLRKRVGDTILITNGKGILLTTEITDDNEKKCAVSIVEAKLMPKKREYNLHIAIAPTKLNDRFEWFLEKATEIGVDEITPIICDRSERKIIKLERLQKLIQSAAKQSLKYHWPKLNKAVSFSVFLKTVDKIDDRFIAHCVENQKSHLSKVAMPEKNTVILIGPEGDFSSKEIDESLAHKFIPVSLGESRLRTETAGIVAVHTLALLNE